MNLGAFSISLAVKDLVTSRSFYEKLGFTVTGGDDEKYLIMINGTTIIGLFQGLFDKNILTFNPGLGQDTSTVADFTDVRDIRASLLADGIRDRQRHGSGRYGTRKHRDPGSGRESDPGGSVLSEAGELREVSAG